MPLALITYNKNLHNRDMSGKKDTTILKGSKRCLKKIALVQNCTTGVEDKMLSTLASPRCDVKDHAVSHHATGELRSHSKFVFSADRRGSRKYLHSWGTLRFQLKMSTSITIYLECL